MDYLSQGYNSFNKDDAKTLNKAYLTKVDISQTFGVKSVSTAVFLTALVILYGVYLVFFSTSLLDELEKNANSSKCSNAKPILQMVYYLGIVMVVLPIVLGLIVWLLPNSGIVKALAPVDKLIRTQITFSVIAVLILLVMLYLDSELKKCSMTIGQPATFISVGAVIIFGCFAGLRAYGDHKDRQEKLLLSKQAELYGRSIGKGVVSTAQSIGSYIYSPINFTKGVLTGIVS